MPAKWNPPLHIQDDPGVVEVANGRLYQGVAITYCPEDIEMFRQGYKCMGPIDSPGLCGEPLESAFPDECPLCRFPVKKLQMEAFERVFKGWKPGGSLIDAEAEIEDMERRRFERERADGLRAKGIVLPRGVSDVG